MKNKFCKSLNEALKDEKKAPIDYSKLKSLTSDKSTKGKISSISMQEKNHFKILTKIQKEKC